MKKTVQVTIIRPVSRKNGFLARLKSFNCYLASPLNLFIAFILLTGCAAYKEPSCSYSSSDEEVDAAHHWLYCAIPRHRSQIRPYDVGHWCTWALFGNDDDGVFGEAPTANYNPEQKPSCLKALCWSIRNPFHNICYYVVGQAHSPCSSYTLIQLSNKHCEAFCYRCTSTTVFPDEESCFYLALHGWKPFISVRIKHSDTRRSDVYLGWRERGNFGIKCQPLKRVEDTPPKLIADLR